MNYCAYAAWSARSVFRSFECLPRFVWQLNAWPTVVGQDCTLLWPKAYSLTKSLLTRKQIEIRFECKIMQTISRHPPHNGINQAPFAPAFGLISFWP